MVKRVTLDVDALTFVAKKVGKTMHEYISANEDIIFVVDHGWVVVTYNKHPNGNLEYELVRDNTTH